MNRNLVDIDEIAKTITKRNCIRCGYNTHNSF